jgi:hypothetical protein
MTSTRSHSTTGRRSRRRIRRPHRAPAQVRRTSLPIGAHVAREETTTDGAW